MTDSAILIALLGVLTGCTLVLTATVVVTAREARATLREARQFFRRANRIARRADLVAARWAGALAGALSWLGSWTQRARAFWTGWVGNGAGHEVRRSHRVSSHLTGG